MEWLGIYNFIDYPSQKRKGRSEWVTREDQSVEIKSLNEGIRYEGCTLRQIIMGWWYEYRDKLTENP